LASIRPVGIAVLGLVDSGFDRLWFASFQIDRSSIAKGLNLTEIDTAPLLTDAAITHQSGISLGDNGICGD
jgi:hypothetical protein